MLLEMYELLVLADQMSLAQLTRGQTNIAVFELSKKHGIITNIVVPPHICKAMAAQDLLD